MGSLYRACAKVRIKVLGATHKTECGKCVMASDPTRLSVRVDRLSRKCETLKIGYATRAEALDGCEQAMDAGRVHPGCHLMPYQCDRCDQWHIHNQRIVFLAPADLSKHDYRKGDHD